LIEFFRSVLDSSGALPALRAAMSKDDFFVLAVAEAILFIEGDSQEVRTIVEELACSTDPELQSKAKNVLDAFVGRV
jgi:hypothetical protein